MTSELNREQSGAEQDFATGDSQRKRPHPRRRIVVTASLLGLLALTFYAAEIAVVAFKLAGH